MPRPAAVIGLLWHEKSLSAPYLATQALQYHMASNGTEQRKNPYKNKLEKPLCLLVFFRSDNGD